MRTIKLVVIGASGVGKTSLRNQYISERFTTGYRATIGADFITKTLPHYANPEEKVTLQIWDTAGQERFSSLSSAFFRGADAVLLMFDVNQPQTLDALTKWWDEFRNRAPVPDEEIDKFCCIFVGNKTDLPWTPPTNGALTGQAVTGDPSAGQRVSQERAQQFMDQLIPPPTLPQPPPSDPPLLIHVNATKGTALDVHPHPNHSPSPPHTSSIDIYHHRRRRQSRSRSRSTLFRGGTIGTMTTTHTLSIYQTPSSSFFDAFESARTSPVPPSSSSSASSAQSSPFGSRSHSPIRSPHRKVSVSSALSDTQTITPSLFVRTNGHAHAPANGDGAPDGDARATPTPTPTPTSTCTTPTPGLPAPAPPEYGTRLFFTSAKTGEGVADVFEYVARRVVSRWEYEEALDARTMHVADGSGDHGLGTIRLGGAPGRQRVWCCSS